jgi:hypothetical protein
MNKPEYDFNDLVRVAGYSPRVFKIAGYRHESHYYPNENWTELIYEMHAVDSGEWLEADGEDLTLVAEADRAEEWMRNNAAKEAQAPRIRFTYFDDEEEEAVTMADKEERKPTARELSNIEAARRKAERKEKAKQVDRLLDELRDYKALERNFGDAEYGDKAFAVEAELKKLAETD